MITDLKYGPWESHPDLVDMLITTKDIYDYPEMKCMQTMHEGPITYLKFWNFWVRVGTPALEASETFFHNYESGSGQVMDLVNDVCGAIHWPHSEVEVWERISTVWDWLRANVRSDGGAYSTLAPAGRWPSIDEFAGYYAAHHELVWASCFSKAHLFAVLLGRVLPRWHVLIASAHHTEGGAPPTASHVYVGVYLTDRWYYLDPTFAFSGPLPSFAMRQSVGGFATVDYQHPFQVRPVPLSPLDKTPHLPD